MSEFAAANTASMVLFVGNPTNVVICEGFRVNNAAFTAYTILPFLACSLTCLITLGIQFRKSKFIPRLLNVSGDLDVRSVLLDPVGAWVGSLILGTCLVVIIAVSFFHIDVWKISLPFAVAKFIFDVAWDHYRYINKRKFGRKKSDEDLSAAQEGIIMNQLRQHTIPRQSSEFPKNEDPPVERNSHNPTFKDVLSTSPDQTRANSRSNTGNTTTETYIDSPTRLLPPNFEKPSLSIRLHSAYSKKVHELTVHFPTFFTALPRLPFALVPFAFSQFILIEALAHQGWIEIFANWLVRASNRQVYPTIWLIGILGVILCNVSGTNIGATILLTKVVRAADFPDHSSRAAAIALAVASNIGAVSFTFSASLAGLLWKQILEQKGIFVKQTTFAYWNILPLIVMTSVGLTVVCAEMAVLFRP